MNKQQFIDYLSQKLEVLNNKEKKEIIDEYCQHIDMKVENGKTEEEAVKDFGDLNEFVKDILDAYHINTETTYKKKTLNDYIFDIVAFLNKTTESILNKDGREIAKIVLEFILLMIVIKICELPFSIFRNFLVYDLFFFLPHVLKSVGDGILVFITNILFLVITLYAIYYFVKKRVLNNEEISFDSFKKDVTNNVNYFKQERQDNYEKQPVYKKEVVVEETQESVKQEIINEENNKEEIIKEENIKEQSSKKQPVRNKVRKERNNNSTAVNLLTIILKVFLFIIMLPAFFSMFGLAIAAIVLSIFYAQGIGLFSIIMVVVGLLLMSMGFSLAILKLIFGGK